MFTLLTIILSVSKCYYEHTIRRQLSPMIESLNQLFVRLFYTNLLPIQLRSCYLFCITICVA